VSVERDGRDVPGHFLSVTQDPRPVPDPALLPSLVHRVSLS
jgi:hypothetical protein